LTDEPEFVTGIDFSRTISDPLIQILKLIIALILITHIIISLSEKVVFEAKRLIWFSENSKEEICPYFSATRIRKKL
jgi:hypothetical protein